MGGREGGREGRTEGWNVSYWSMCANTSVCVRGQIKINMYLHVRKISSEHPYLCKRLPPPSLLYLSRLNALVLVQITIPCIRPPNQNFSPFFLALQVGGGKGGGGL